MRRLSILPRLLIAIAGTALIGALVSAKIHHDYAAGLIRQSVESHMDTVLAAARNRLRTSVVVPGTVELKAFSVSSEIDAYLSAFASGRLLQRVAVERLFLSAVQASNNKNRSLRLVDAVGTDVTGISNEQRLRDEAPIGKGGDADGV